MTRNNARFFIKTVSVTISYTKYTLFEEKGNCKEMKHLRKHICLSNSLLNIADRQYFKRGQVAYMNKDRVSAADRKVEASSGENNLLEEYNAFHHSKRICQRTKKHNITCIISLAK